MERTEHYASYVEILKEELIPAMGCTEPIAIALAAAKARQTLGELPVACKVEVSGNIIKNVKAVTVPNTGGHKGIEAATAAGVVAGKADLMLEVLSQVTEEEITAMAEFLRTTEIAVVPALGRPGFLHPGDRGGWRPQRQLRDHGLSHQHHLHLPGRTGGVPGGGCLRSRKAADGPLRPQRGGDHSLCRLRGYQRRGRGHPPADRL